MIESDSMILVTVSGGFDPLHKGHLRLFEEAKRRGDRLAVIVNDDRWVSKKHKVLMPQLDRAEVINAITHADMVLLDQSGDGDVSKTLQIVRPQIHVVGPDHSNIRSLQEYQTCVQLGIEIVCLDHLQKDDLSSSSGIIKNFKGHEWHNPPVVVNTIIKNPAGEALVCERGHADGRGMLELPGGFLESGETLEQGARREVQEELCLELPQLAYLNSYQGHYSDKRRIVSVVFVATSAVSPLETQEVPRFWWVNTLPPQEKFFGDCDWQALKDYFQMADRIRGD